LLIIDHDKKFQIDIDKSSFIDRDDFLAIVEFFKKIMITYNLISHKWLCDDKRIDEICLWFDRLSYEYKFTQKAIDKINELKESLYPKETIFYRNRQLDFSIYNEGEVPFEFQVQDINWRLRRSAYLDCNSAGLGKSFVSISVAAQNYKENLIDSIFIICPSGMVFHWKYEILKFVNVFKEEDIEIITNDNKFSIFENNINKKIIIISNNTKVFGDMIAFYKPKYKKGDSLKNIKWGLFKIDIKKLWNKNSIMLIADESHFFQHSSSIRTKVLKTIKKNFDYRALLTATPNINNFESIYPQLNIVDTSLIPFSENGFKLHIAKEMGDKYGIYNITEYDTQAIVSIKTKWVNNFAQRLKEDVPEMKVRSILQEVYFDLTEEQKKLYRIILDRELSILQEDYDTITWKLLFSKFHLICEVFDNPLLLNKRHYSEIEIQNILKKWSIKQDPKFIALEEKLENYIENNNEKVVIYDYHPETLDELFLQLKKYNPQIIHGSLKDIESKEIDRRNKENIFNNDSECKIFLLSALTSSAGLNLQKRCHRIIVYSMPFSGIHFKQLGERTNRIVSEVDSIIEIFCYPKTIDNIRVKRNLNRIQLNDRWGKEITQEQLEKLINGNF
jgi:hypothetical protein